MRTFFVEGVVLLVRLLHHAHEQGGVLTIIHPVYSVRVVLNALHLTELSGSE